MYQKVANHNHQLLQTRQKHPGATLPHPRITNAATHPKLQKPSQPPKKRITQHKQTAEQKHQHDGDKDPCASDER
jgi:hypothetical protein